MVKCPFCSFNNEDGALFCEQCKSDVSNVAPTPAGPPAVAAVEEAPIMAAIVEEPVEVVAVAIMEETPAAAIVVEEIVAVAVVQPPPAPVAPPPPVVAAPAPPPAAAPVGAAPAPIPPGSTIKLVVQRGLKPNDEYTLFSGENFVGRADDKPVDVDLTFQEPEDRVWCSRQHALINWDEATGILTVEDLNSANGTFVNRERVYPGQPKQLFAGSTVQIGTVHMRVKV